LFRRDHATRCAVREGNLAHERRIGNVSVAGGIARASGVVSDDPEPRRVVVSEVRLGEWDCGVEGSEICSAKELIVTVGHGKAIKGAAAVAFGQDLACVVVGQGRGGTRPSRADCDLALPAKAIKRF